MKTINYIILIFVFLINTVSLFPQEIFKSEPLPDSLRQEIKAKLISNDSYDNHDAARQLALFYYDSTGEMNDILVSKIFKQERSEIRNFIYALMGGGYGKPELMAVLHKLIDSVDYMPKGMDDTPLIEHKYEFASLLMHMGDFSKVNYIFLYIDNYIGRGKADDIMGDAIDNLSYIEDKYPEYQSQVTEYYKKLIRSGTPFWTQKFNVSLSLDELIERNDPEVTDLCKYMIKYDTERNIPASKALDYLQENRPPDLEEFLKDEFINGNDTEQGAFKKQIMRILHMHYNCPKTYKLIKDYILTTTDIPLIEIYERTIARDSNKTYPRLYTMKELKYPPLKKEGGKYIVTGEPPVWNDPRDTTFKTINYIDSMYSFNKQSYDFGWIRDLQVYEANKTKIEELKNLWESGNETEFRIKLCQFRNGIKTKKEAGLISYEGYQYLYWYPSWISGDCSGVVEENPNLIKNPDMEDGTVEYWYTNNPYGGAVCTLKVNNNLPISGGYDAKLNISVAGTANDRPLLIVYLKENKELGAVYTFTFKTKVTSGSPAIKYINYGDGLKLFGGTLSGEQEWTFTTSSATNSTDNIAIYIDGTRQSSFTLDNLVYKKVLADNPPVITVQPASVTVNEGETAAFNIAAKGAGLLSYQWQKNGTDTPSATENEYTTPATVISDSGSIFKCVVTNQFGSVTSNEAVLSVIQPGTDTTSVNLVYNPRFENGTTDGYEISNTYGGAEYAFDINTTNPIAGNNDAVLNITQAGTSTDRPLIIIYLNENKVTGETYNFSFKTKV
ncbi:MAG: hypothetical protein GXX85_04685, partial [Ignavibacteria bacterium]|nr:hypothetical protein [Ignavibacteria bacterium]